ncbi:hypothetical protein Plhal703r1_c38g0134341 [Plasmopara halstedii]
MELVCLLNMPMHAATVRPDNIVQISVPAMRTILVVLAPCKTDAGGEELFERSQSRDEVDVRVERHLRFEFANLKVERRLPAYCLPATCGIIHHAPLSSVVSQTGESTTTAAQGHSMISAQGPSASLATTEKRGAS